MDWDGSQSTGSLDSATADSRQGGMTFATLCIVVVGARPDVDVDEAKS